MRLAGEVPAVSHGMSALACLHAGDLRQQDLPRQCALAEDNHAAVMPADTLQHNSALTSPRHASVPECLTWRTWPSIERPVHCSCTNCLTASLAFCRGSLPCPDETVHARQCRSWPGLCLLTDLRPLSCCTCNVSSLACIQHSNPLTYQPMSYDLASFPSSSVSANRKAAEDVPTLDRN